MTGRHRVQTRGALLLRGDSKQPAPRISVDRRQEPSWSTVLVTTARLWIERRRNFRARRYRSYGRRNKLLQRWSIGHVARRESSLTRQMTGVALVIAGHRREYLREAWRADLYGQDGRYLSVKRQLRHGAGYLIAAVKYRLLNDLGGTLVRLLDAMLVSRMWTWTVITCVYAVPVAMILSRQGSYGLIENVGGLAVMAGALGAGLRWLRRWRGVQPPKRDTPSRGK